MTQRSDGPKTSKNAQSLSSIHKRQSSSPSYRTPALEKGLDVLELLAQRRAPLALHEMSRALQRSVSELFRMVHTLRERGYIELDGDGYVLTDRLFSFAVATAPATTLVDLGRPLMRRLAERVSQSVHISIASGREIVVLTQVDAPGDVAYSVRPGHHKPLIESASGLVLLAFQPPEVSFSWLTDHGLDRDDPLVAAFLANAEHVRAQGFAREQSSIMEGVTDLSAPVETKSGIIAALTMPYVRRRKPGSSEDEAIVALRETAAALSRALQA